VYQSRINTRVGPRSSTRHTCNLTTKHVKHTNRCSDRALQASWLPSGHPAWRLACIQRQFAAFWCLGARTEAEFKAYCQAYSHCVFPGVFSASSGQYGSDTLRLQSVAYRTVLHPLDRIRPNPSRWRLRSQIFHILVVTVVAAGLPDECEHVDAAGHRSSVQVSALAGFQCCCVPTLLINGAGTTSACKSVCIALAGWPGLLSHIKFLRRSAGLSHAGGRDCQGRCHPPSGAAGGLQ
jgi:hypothetical protein